MPQILGKNILLTPDDPPRTYADFHALLVELNLRDALRTIGQLFAATAPHPGGIAQMQGYLAPSYAFPNIALELIQSATDRNTKQLDEAIFGEILACFHALPFADATGNGAQETLLRFGQGQFSFQRRDRFQLARVLRVFRDIWPLVPECQSLDIDEAITSAFGVGLEQTLLFGAMFAAQSTNGFVTPYPEETGDDFLTRLFTTEAQQRFLKRISATYEDLRRADRTSTVPDELRKYRFNPLAVYPLVIPDEPPKEIPGPVYIAPCQQFVIDRITDGLVYDLRKNLGDQFSSAFGKAVERYVGQILLDAFGSTQVRGEFSYRIGKRKVLSPDWLVHGDDCAVVVEVKRSLLYSRARNFGELDAVKQDLQVTLQKACAQLVQFRKDVHAIPWLPAAHNLELVVATWDPVWWTKLLLQQVSNVPQDLHIHVMSIAELETLIARSTTSNDLYQILWSKRTGGSDGADMDVEDWMAHTYGGDAPPPLASLLAVHHQFFGQSSHTSEAV